MAIQKQELKRLISQLGIRIKGNYVKKSDIKKALAESDDEDKITVYDFVFLQREDDVQHMQDELGEDPVDADDATIFNYLKAWDYTLEEHDSKVHDASDLNSEFLGYVVDDKGKRIPSSKVKDLTEGYLFSRNDGLRYYGLSYFKRGVVD